MKLLLFSDLHADAHAARQLAARAPAFDVLVGAGDFGNVRQDVGVCIDVLRRVNVPAVLVPGNNESAEELTEACRDWPRAVVLHGTAATVAGVTFFGLGGGVPVTPFGAWSFDLTEKEAGSLLAGCPAGCVLVSHSPPRGAVDVSSRGQSLGSMAVRATVEHVRPRLVVCGHIHACAGRREQVGPTPVVNAGPGGVEWLLEEPDDA
jgi:Icc-related predicted phosphoesterase